MERLRTYLDRNEIAQVEFARRLGVSQPTVWGWVSGDSLPSAEMLKKISNETGLSIDDLLGHVPRRSGSKTATDRKAI
jgi:transcriptional regulator with XRE-family HTH domain